VKKILIIGRGFLGDYIFQELKRQPNKIFTTIHKNASGDNIFLDISNSKMVEQVFDEINPDIVINCAANTNVDYLEENPQQAYDVNSLGPKNLAILCSEKKSRLIHVSTDGIFDGKKGMYKENDVPNPVNVYGRSKLDGEKLIHEYSSNYVILRTNFFGFHGQNRFLFNWMFNSLKNNEKIIGFEDAFFNPLEISNLATMIEEIAFSKYQGIIHLSSDSIVNKYQFALKIAEEFQFDKSLIIKGSITNSNLKAQRPADTTLDNTKAKFLLKTNPISIENSLKIIKRKFYKDIF